MDLTTAVRETCVLARVSSSALGLSRTDKQASKRAAQDAHAVDGAARVVVSRLAGADDLHKEIASVQNAARGALTARSMPYDEAGWRLLPNAQLERFMAEMDAHQRQFDDLLARLRAEADEIVRRAYANKGAFEVDVPSPDELVEAYALKHDYQPIPDASTFRGLPPATADKLARALERRVASAVAEAQTDTLQRMLTPLECFVERMRLYDQREADIAAGKEVGRHGVFRDTVLTNLQELIEVVGDFNIAGDERIDQLKASLEVFTKIEPDVLRSNEKVRKAAAARAAQAVSNLNDWLSPVARIAAE